MSTDRFDFHVHTLLSDGARTASEVFERATRAGLSGLSITDHDTIDAYEMLENCQPGGESPRLLPGLEISTSLDGVELHILGYFPDGFPPEIPLLVDRLLVRRNERMRVGIERLARRGLHLAWEDLQKEVGGRVVSRSHLAMALVKRRLVPHFQAAFPDLLGPETVPPPEADSREVVEELTRMGGIPVWAHPGRGHFEQFLVPLVQAGLKGVELLIPRRRLTEKRRMARELAEHGLLVTGGSDWHGHKDDKFGRFSVERREVPEFLRAIGWGEETGTVNPPRA